MKFIMSYSCGKDSTLALHKMIEQGNEPVALLVMVNENVDRSFFHGADYVMLEAYSKTLDLPLLITPSDGENYHLAMEASLRKAKTLGAEVACFGDITVFSEEELKNAVPDQEKSFGIHKVWVNGNLILDNDNLELEAMKSSGQAIGVF